MPVYTSIDGVKRQLTAFYESVGGTKVETITKYAGHEGEKRIIFSKAGAGYIKFMIATTDGIYYTLDRINWVKLISDTITEAYIDGIQLSTGEKKWAVVTYEYYSVPGMSLSAYRIKVYLIDELNNDTPVITTLHESELNSYKLYSNIFMTENCIWTVNENDGNLTAFKYDGTSFAVTPKDTSNNTITDATIVDFSSKAYLLQWINGDTSEDSTAGFIIYSYPTEAAGTSVSSLLASGPKNLNNVTSVYSLDGTSLTSSDWTYTLSSGTVGPSGIKGETVGGAIEYPSAKFKYFNGRLYNIIYADIGVNKSSSKYAYQLYGVMEISYENDTLTTRVFIEPNKTTSYTNYRVKSLIDVNESGIFYTRNDGNLYYKPSMDSAEVQLSWGFTPSFLETSIDNSAIAITPPDSYVPDNDSLSENTVWTGSDISTFVTGTINNLSASHLSVFGSVGANAFLNLANGTEILVNESGTYVPYIKVSSNRLIRKYLPNYTSKAYVYIEGSTLRGSDYLESKHIRTRMSSYILSIAKGEAATESNINSYANILGSRVAYVEGTTTAGEYWLSETYNPGGEFNTDFYDPIVVYYVTTSGSIGEASGDVTPTHGNTDYPVDVSAKYIRPILELTSPAVIMEENADGTIKFKGD